MPKQPAFSGFRDARKKKQTRQELFLAEMDAVVAWGRLLALVFPTRHKIPDGSGVSDTGSKSLSETVR